MEKQLIVRMQGQFDALAQTVPDENVEYWFVRDLQGVLEYTEWRNFQKTIAKAEESCKNAGVAVKDHFVDVNRMVEIGSGKLCQAPLCRFAMATRPSLRVFALSARRHPCRRNTMGCHGP